MGRLEMSEEGTTADYYTLVKAVEEYEKALLAAFPEGATGDVFTHWNNARQLVEQRSEG
jgi:hypothetical protein